MEAKGYDVDTEFAWPVGLTFQPYVEFDNGLGVGMGLGPMMIVATNQDADFFNLPVNLNLRYSFLPKEKISPYVRAGASYNITSGDYVEGSKIGFLGALGVEFLRKSPVGFGLEVGYDSSEIEFEEFERPYPYGVVKKGTKDIAPINWWASIFIVF
ncbi:MAG: outer membrane beta-barrel protein [Nitrospirota bacterium]